MSKQINQTAEAVEEHRTASERALNTARTTDSKTSSDKVSETVSEKAIVHFTEVAWLKMQALIKTFDGEVAWHGVAYRGDNKAENNYYITDIIVYPQEVSGTTVEMDTSEYAVWIQRNSDKLVNVRMQGHSHVNMMTSPSSTDLDHQKKIFDQLKNDMFYIFMIWNKSNSGNIRIFDKKKNILFENDDITYDVLSGGYGIDKFIKEVKQIVKNKHASLQGENNNTNIRMSEQRRVPIKETPTKEVLEKSQKRKSVRHWMHSR